MRRPGFTLIEMLIVLILIGIVASIGFVNYGNIKESTLDKEAASNLKLIQAAENIYRLEHYPNYYAGGSALVLNRELKLFLPLGTKMNWEYLTTNNGCAQANRVNSPVVRTWRLRIGEDTPAGPNARCP